MEGNISAVITGDIIGSTRIEEDYQKVLHQIGRDIQDHLDDQFIIDIYRGDSFQTISNKPEKGLLIVLIIKAGLRRFSNKKGSSERQWDARLSLGIGLLDDYPNSNSLGGVSGEPFVRSGRVLDHMKENGHKIKITTGKERIDEELDAVCPLIEAITNRWSTAQSDAIYLLLLRKNITQLEIGRELGGKSQRAIGKRLEASNIDNIKLYLKRFEKLIDGL